MFEFDPKQPLDMLCPWCRAEPQVPCLFVRGTYHPSRIEAAERINLTLRTTR